MNARCWLWVGAMSQGYGYARVDGKAQRVHRLVYEALVGPIPEGLVLDHLCRNRSCYNPAHLEPVTRGENVRRSPLIGRSEGSRTWRAKRRAAQWDV